jgi:hypothetical protein
VKKKIGTVLNEDLLRRARSIAATEGKRLNQVIEEALSEYLLRKFPRVTGGVAARTAGCLALPKSRVERILRQEPGILDR